MQVLLDFNNMQESLKSSGYTNRKLATRFKVTHTTVNGYFNKKAKFDFMHFVDALRLYKPKDIKFRRGCIKECIPTLSHKNLKLALEVLDMFGEYELQDMIIQQINKYKSSQTENEKEK
ncbi:AimR family lysis-lysogeny pheromone receptor, partial [Bacillus cereus]|nr:AimR family lysis-lysogeny pheromone receptor [Bacillus cereus]